jgi:hypothetical protein
MGSLPVAMATAPWRTFVWLGQKDLFHKDARKAPSHLWGAHASRVLAMATSPSRTFALNLLYGCSRMDGYLRPYREWLRRVAITGTRVACAPQTSRARSRLG